MNKQNTKILCINAVYPDATSITKPVWPGVLHDVYIAETTKGKYICRFSGKQNAEYNLYISNLLQKHNIKVPCISVQNVDNTYIETYPFISGKTFYERLIEGMPKEKSAKIYEQLFDIVYKITKINYDINKVPALPWVTKTAINIFKQFNPHEKITLCHNDMHAKNVILDEEDNIRALIDMDSIYPGQFSMAMRLLIQKFTVLTQTD